MAAKHVGSFGEMTRELRSTHSSTSINVRRMDSGLCVARMVRGRVCLSQTAPASSYKVDEIERLRALSCQIQ
jgi:hypothetical protein